MSPSNKHASSSPPSADQIPLGAPGDRIQIKPCFSIPTDPAPIPPLKSSKSLTPTQEEEKKDRSGKLIIGQGVFVLYEIKSCKNLFVQGGIETSLQCEELKISETGELIGDAVVMEADIHGLFKGDLTVKGCMTVRAGGRVFGKINYNDIKIEPGGIVSGYVNGTSDADASNSELCPKNYPTGLIGTA